MSHAERITRVQELALLAMLHAEHPEADNITIEHVTGKLWTVCVETDGNDPERYFLKDWKA